jgi:hypothetical protein
MNTPEFATNKELFAWLHSNKGSIMATKCAAMKHGDGVECAPVPVLVTKAAGMPEDSDDVIHREVVINTTNLMDGHNDVHIPGLWTKTIRENRNVLHIQEHELKFDHIITDGADLKAEARKMSWADLGQDYPGVTEALIFKVAIRKSRNPFMFEQYKAGRVVNHSVGMRYVKIDVAVNDREWPEEFKTWEKYIGQVVNREAAEAIGYFFPVTEAKLIEGSAVPIGSNWITPTLPPQEPQKSTPPEPPKGTPFDVMAAIKQTKFLI